MTHGDTMDRAVQDFLRARGQNPDLTPEDFCRDTPGLPAGVMPVLQGLTLSPDASNTLTPAPAGAAGGAPPKQLGVYAIKKKLGEGGMGTVYLGVDTRLDREVAVKVMRPEIASQPSPAPASCARPRRWRPSSTSTSPPFTPPTKRPTARRGWPWNCWKAKPSTTR